MWVGSQATTHKRAADVWGAHMHRTTRFPSVLRQKSNTEIGLLHTWLNKPRTVAEPARVFEPHTLYSNAHRICGRREANQTLFGGFRRELTTLTKHM